MKELFTPAEASRIVSDLTPNGLIAAANRGELRVAGRTPSGRRLFSRKDLEAFKLRRENRRTAAQHNDAAPAAGDVAPM